MADIACFASKFLDQRTAVDKITKEGDKHEGFILSTALAEEALRNSNAAASKARNCKEEDCLTQSMAPDDAH